ncbi:hypothetical protein GCK72_009502 [Caenorhabditis remanei]|uniref:Uncharacterized protein n=1 Tax=Caenorhabditis remanei TaxID=31234 RepID=A0A6A5H0K3_CAERE|nr:hypothetical protein GCK72_009502 [Caenorhabditis remanei]KAF1761248.1 hypothetical protein GCK72_009502 [Caenorhabditis remanei]
MIAAVIPIYVIVLCNMAHIVLAIFFFPSIVEFLEDLYWNYTHRSWFIEYVPETEVEWLKDEEKSVEKKNMKKRHYINHSNVSILIDKADLYDQSIEGKKRRDVVNYSLGENKDFDEYLRFREHLKMLQQAYDDGILIKKQNFSARVHERMVEQHIGENKVIEKKLARTR